MNRVLLVVRHCLAVTTLLIVVLAAEGLISSEGAEAGGRQAVYRVEITESFHCGKLQDFCAAVIPFESDQINHESAVLYDDGTGHNEFTVHCRADAEPFCRAGTTTHISMDFNWFSAPAECGELGCVPLEGDCVPDEFQTCTPYFWRDSPDVWTFNGCAELSSQFILTCARRGSPAVTIEDPAVEFGGSYPDLTFWPAVPGHYTFNDEPWNGCFDFPVNHCPPGGINVQYQIIKLR